MKRAGKCAGKKAYSHKNKVLDAARVQYLNHNTKTAFYECPTCLDFHLTTKHLNPKMDKYFSKWDRQWMVDRYNEFLSIEKQIMDKYCPSEKTLKNRAKRQRYKANKIKGQNEPTKRQLNTLPLSEQKAFFHSFDSKIYPQPKSFWSQILDIISRTGSRWRS